MKIAVTDASIFIDLIECEACGVFFRLPYQIITSYQVWMELGKEQQKILEKWREDQLTIIKIEKDFIQETNEKNLSSSLSIADRSVWFLSHDMKGILLTSDGLLRKMGRKQGVKSHGLLWVFDRLVDECLLEQSEAIEKLELVFNVNPFYKNDTKLRQAFKNLKKKWY